MNDVIPYQSLAPTYERPLSPVEIRQQVNLIQEVMRDVMKPGVHYGYPPGTEPKTEAEKKTKKPALLKPGSELLCVVFRFDPHYEIERTRLPDGHLEVVSESILHYIPNGRRVGSGWGSATTEESKHAYRWALRTCPQCEQPAIIKSRFGGWYCYDKKGGCGAKFQEGDPDIENQEAGRIANPDLADQHNTVLKMANKRALNAAVLTATAASDMFDQDIEEINPEADYDPGAQHGAKNAQPKVEQPQRKETRQDTSSSSAPETTGTGGVFKPMIPQMKKMIEARLANAKLTKLDLKGKFGKDLDATDDNGFAFSDYNAIEQWISQNAKA